MMTVAKAKATFKAAEVKQIDYLIDNAKVDERWVIDHSYSFEFDGTCYELLEIAGRQYPMVYDYYDKAEFKKIAKRIIETGKL